MNYTSSVIPSFSGIHYTFLHGFFGLMEKTTSAMTFFSSNNIEYNNYHKSNKKQITLNLLQ